MHQRGGVHPRALLEQHRAALRTEIEPPHAECARNQFELRDAQQVLRRRRQRAEAIVQLRGELIELRLARCSGDALVERQTHVHIGDVSVRQEGRQAQLHLGGGGERLIEERLAARLQRLHRMLEHVEVQRQPDLGHLTALLLAEQLAGAADLEIVSRQHEAGTELFHRFDGLETLRGIARQRLPGRRDEVGIGAVVRAADAAAQLMQLRQAHAVGAVDHDGIGARHVDAAFNDGGAHQHAEAAVIEIHHELLEIPLAHLAMADAHARFRHQRLHLGGDFLDGAHFVVHEVDLAAAPQLAQRRLAHRRRVPLDEEGLDGQTRGGRRSDERQVAQPAERHVERARDGGGGEGEHVHVGAQRLQALLVAHPEAMLLVDDEEPEVLEARVGVQQAMRGDDDVHLALLEPLEDHLRFLRTAEARQPLDAYRPVSEAIAEVREVLLHEQRGRREHRDLLAGLCGDERRTHRHFRLAETDIAAHDAVHGALSREVREHLADRLRLVLGLLERKGVGERLVIELAHRERESRLCLAPRVQIEQLRSHIADLLRGAPACPRPLVGAELVERGVLGCRARVAAHQVQCVHRHVDAIAVLVFEHQELPGLAADLHVLQTLVAADAVLLVHDRGARVEVLQVAQDRFRVRDSLAAPLDRSARPEQLCLGNHRDRRGREREAGQIRRHREHETRAAGGEGIPALDDAHLVVVRAQHLVQHFTPAGGVGGDQHAPLERAQERIERGKRLGCAHIDAQLARGRAGKVAHRLRLAVQLGLRFERIEGNAGEGAEVRVELCRVEKQLRGFQQWTLEVVAALLVALADVLPGLDQGCGESGVVDDHGIGGQVVEQRRHRIEEQRLVELHTRRRQPLAHAAIDAAAVRVALEARAVAAAKVLHGLRIERHFARRQQPHARQRVERALRVRVESTDGLDLLVEQVDAQRRRRTHREHIEERAAHRELAGADHLADACVAGLGEALPEGLDGERLALHELERPALHVLAWRQALHERVGGDDQATVARVRQLVKRLQPLGDDVRVRREQIVRQHLPVRQPQQRQRARGEESQLRRQPLELARTVGDQHVQPAVGTGRLGQRERRGAAIELMPAQARRGGGRRRRVEECGHRHRSWRESRTAYLSAPGHRIARAAPPVQTRAVTR